MRQWILGIVAASLLSSIAMILTPAGRVKTVTRMVCGLICALTIVAPVLQIDIDDLSAGISSYGQEAEDIEQQAEEEARMMEGTYIEEECAAYILAKATELDVIVGTVNVSAQWDEEALVWYPWEVSISGGYDEDLSRVIEEDLGIPAERQVWSSDER